MREPVYCIRLYCKSYYCTINVNTQTLFFMDFPFSLFQIYIATCPFSRFSISIQLSELKLVQGEQGVPPEVLKSTPRGTSICEPLTQSIQEVNHHHPFDLFDKYKKYILGQMSSAQSPKTEQHCNTKVLQHKPGQHKGYESQVMTFCHMHYSDSLPCHPVSHPRVHKSLDVQRSESNIKRSTEQ